MKLRAGRGQACPAFEEQLEDYLEGRLDLAAAAAVESHARACPRCGPALECAVGAAPFLRLLRQGQPAATPLFAARVMAAIRGERGQQELWRPVETAAWRLCWLATALAVILAVFMLRLQFAPPPLPAQQNQAQALVNGPMPQSTADDTFLLVASDDHAR